MVETFGIVWVLDELWDGRVLVTRCLLLVELRSSSQSLDQVTLTFFPGLIVYDV